MVNGTWSSPYLNPELSGWIDAYYLGRPENLAGLWCRRSASLCSSSAYNYSGRFPFSLVVRMIVLCFVCVIDSTYVYAWWQYLWIPLSLSQTSFRSPSSTKSRIVNATDRSYGRSTVSHLQGKQIEGHTRHTFTIVAVQMQYFLFYTASSGSQLIALVLGRHCSTTGCLSSSQRTHWRSHFWPQITASTESPLRQQQSERQLQVSLQSAELGTLA